MPRGLTRSTHTILSASSLGLFKECPRCFWLQVVKRIHRPRGVFPSLPGGMDLVIKEYFDQFRGKSGLPPELREQIQGELFDDQKTLESWRNWRTGLRVVDETRKVEIVAALDDCLRDTDGKLVPLDYKTRGSELKENSTSYYEHQLDLYSWILEKNGFPAADYAYLLFFYPLSVKGHGLVQFAVEPRRMPTSKTRAQALVDAAVACLSGPCPKSHSACEWCSWGNVEED